jgi:Uma2 family endonuclease
VVFFAAVAGTTESLQVADVVAAAAGEGNDVIDSFLVWPQLWHWFEMWRLEPSYFHDRYQCYMISIDQNFGNSQSPISSGGYMTIIRAHGVDSLPMDISTLKLTDEQFYQLCVTNPEQPLELTAQGVLIVMSPVGGDSGRREIRLGGQLLNWNDNTELGEVFSSSTIFKLPSGSQRSPDAAWVESSRWVGLTPKEQERFPPIAPDFVIELRSRTDSLTELQAKMQEYIANGVRLGWLVNPQDQQVEIYRIDRSVELLQSPSTVSGEDVLPGFVLNLAKIW